jgi:hypothetical protein
VFNPYRPSIGPSRPIFRVDLDLAKCFGVFVLFFFSFLPYRAPLGVFFPPIGGPYIIFPSSSSRLFNILSRFHLLVEILVSRINSMVYLIPIFVYRRRLIIGVFWRPNLILRAYRSSLYIGQNSRRCSIVSFLGPQRR